MSLTIVDSEKLENHIEEMKKLRETWKIKVEQPLDIGENGGNTIAQVEELGQTVLDMRQAFLELLDRTISYMTGRKETLESNEAKEKAVLEAATRGEAAR
jgi:hypothetical protein